MKNYLSILALVFTMQLSAVATESAILLTIDTTKVTADEFMRIYNKNSSITVEDKKTIDEYLDLFINYKLKVVEATHLGYDTVSSFIKEMEGYADQLAKPYLDDEDILNSYVEESYERYKKEINASHILLRLDERARPSDTLNAYNKIVEMRQAFLDGDSFEKIIADNSPAPGQEIGGNLGWFSAMRMVYPFETAAYNTPVGEVSNPVRTQFGYHLINIKDKRENRGEVKLSHIMAMYPRQNPNDLEIEASKNKIMQAFKELEADVAWDSVTAKYSEHRSTRNKGGDLGWVKSGMIPDTIVSVSLSLEDGTYSKPFQSMFGWHIVKIDGKRPIPEYEVYKKENQNKIKQSSIIKQLSHKQHIEQIKEQNDFSYDKDGLNAAIAKADSNWFKSDWQPDETLLNITAFTISDRKFSQYDVISFLIKKKQLNLMIAKNDGYDPMVNSLIENKLLQYEREMLPTLYPEYKMLLNEYYDGILLFNLTEDVVWQKAVEDTTGLTYFYSNLDKRYDWDKRIVIAKYTYPDSAMIGNLLKVSKQRAKKNYSETEISAMVCGHDTIPFIGFEILKYEKGDNSVADSLKWKPKSYLTSKDNNNWVLYFVENILPAKTKELTEARGLYTADYQTYLEEKWIDELRSKYSITVDEEVLNSLKSQE